MNVSEKAAKYAEGKANEVITKAIAQAYAEGYQDGYKDKEAEIPAEFQDDKTNFLDLGLPSGTLWAKDYEKEDEATLYLPFGTAGQLSLPTLEQWKELKTCCRWKFDYTYRGNNQYWLEGARCIGPNGNYLYFEVKGKKEALESSDDYEVLFWLKDSTINGLAEQNAARIYNDYGTGKNGLIDEKYIFCGFMLPVRLVR